MNVSELARLLKVSPQEMLEKLPEMGFDIGQRAIKVDNSVANKIMRIWPKYIRQLQAKQKFEDFKHKEARPEAVKKTIEVPNFITIRDLAQLAGLPVNVVLSELMKNGIFASLNEKIDFDTASIIADDLGIEVKIATGEGAKNDESKITLKQIIEKEDKASLMLRPPVIVVMGHVDHGKTKLLDSIRTTDVVAGEAGGITQHIGAYQVKRNNKIITFIDTPGHEAFTAMRSRGARIADLAILVVAADDGVMPQTVEAYRIIEAAKIPFVVAINKIDKPEANIDKTKQELSSKLNLVPEDWGGNVVCAPVSAKDGIGIDKLLDVVLLIMDMESENLQANPDTSAVGTVIESHLDKNEGPVATILVQNGTLKMGDQLCMNNIFYGKVRSLKNYRGENVESADPSTPVKIIGLKVAPEVGDVLMVGEGEKVKFHRKGGQQQPMAENKIEDDNQNIKKINLIVKADVLGSAEAIEESLEKISSPDIKAKIIFRGLGNINEGDIKRAEASNATILGFNVKSSSAIDDMAREKGLNIKLYRIIYDLINDIKKQMEEMLEPELKRIDLGIFKAKAIFRKEAKSQIVGGVVTRGKIEKESMATVVRNGQFVDEGKVSNVQSGKENVNMVDEGQECGVQYEGNPIVQAGDELHFYKTEKITKKL